MPVSVPVNPGPYGDPGSMLHASPQMSGHSSVSPRPSSSSGMLDVGGSNNGYQQTSSPLPESPTPPPPSAIRSSSSMANRSLSPQHLAGAAQRHNLRLAIPPGNQAGLAISSHDRGRTSINPSLCLIITVFSHIYKAQRHLVEALNILTYPN